MKRIVALVSAVLMTFAVSICYADSFTIHSGTSFGMSKADVVSLEKAAGFEMKDDDLVKNTKATKQIKGYGKIAGVDLSDIVYMFDSDDKLFAVVYHLGGWTTPPDLDFETVEQALIKKYGNPDPSWYVVAQNIGYEPLNYFYDSMTGGTPPASSWIVENDDGTCVIISHFKASAKLTASLSAHMHIVGYQQYPNDVINGEITNINDLLDENQNQLNDDL